MKAVIFGAAGVCRAVATVAESLLVYSLEPSDVGWLPAEPGWSSPEAVPLLVDLGPYAVDPETLRITLG